MVSRSRNLSGPAFLNKSDDLDMFHMPNFEHDEKDTVSLLQGCDNMAHSRSLVDFE